MPAEGEQGEAPLETVGTREVDEADAVEQSRAVPDDEDYPRG